MRQHQIWMRDLLRLPKYAIKNLKGLLLVLVMGLFSWAALIYVVLRLLKTVKILLGLNVIY